MEAGNAGKKERIPFWTEGSEGNSFLHMIQKYPSGKTDKKMPVHKPKVQDSRCA